MALACLGAGFAGYRLAGARYSRPAAPAYGTWLARPRALGAFALTDSRNRPFRNAELRGHLTLMYFGYTRCTDECPAALALLAQVQQRLARLPLQVLFVSVDPRHDTPAVLAQFVRRFDPLSLGLTGPLAQIGPLSARLGVARGRVALPGGDTTFEHTMAIFLLDARGREVALFTPPFDARRLAAAVQGSAERLLTSG